MRIDQLLWALPLALLLACGAPSVSGVEGEQAEAAGLMLALPAWESAWVDGELQRPPGVFGQYLDAARVLVQMDPETVRRAMAEVLAWAEAHDRVAHGDLQARLYVLNRLLFVIPPDLVEPERRLAGWRSIPPVGDRYRAKPLAWPVQVDGAGRVVGLETHKAPTWYRAIEEFDEFRGRFEWRRAEALGVTGR